MQRESYRRWYGCLLRLYPESYRQRFGESMAQTFNDLLRERESETKPLLRCALWLFAETLTGIAREHMTAAVQPNKSILRVALITGLILLIPLMGELFSEEMDWDLFDFVVAGGMIFGTGLAYELVAKRGGSTAYKVAAAIALAACFFLTWINLAVGVIGSENNPANLMYFGVVAVALIGSALAGFKAQGMAHALFATALAQFMVPVIALLVWQPQMQSQAQILGIVQVLVLNSVFVMLFAASGLLFRRARPTGEAL